MKLNHDCIRDLLLVLERSLIIDDQGKTHFLKLEDVACIDSMKLYSRADIIYCSLRLAEADLINISYSYAGAEIYYMFYNYITFEGHQYLDSIRDKTVWGIVKEKLKSIGGAASFKLIMAIAEKAVLQLVGL